MCAIKAVPAGCQWINRGAQGAIQMATRILKKMETNHTLDFQELPSTFHGVTMILIQRPLAAKKLAGEEFEFVTSSMLLLGHTLVLKQLDPETLDRLQTELPKSWKLSKPW